MLDGHAQPLLGKMRPFEDSILHFVQNIKLLLSEWLLRVGIPIANHEFSARDHNLLVDVADKSFDKGSAPSLYPVL